VEIKTKEDIHSLKKNVNRVTTEWTDWVLLLEI